MAKHARHLVLCISNDGYEASLETRKVYVALHDEIAAKHRLVRVIDESGEDYLYPRKLFASVDLPPSLRRAVFAAV
jgi:hypothetical protein